MEPTDSFVVLYKALQIEDEDKRIQTLRTLIDSGVDVNSCWNMKCKSMPGFNNEGYTVLIVAVCKGHVDCVQVLIDAGANVNQSDVRGQTALKQSASKGHGECLKVLLEAGADANLSDVVGQTALLEAASKGNVECMKLLLEAGAGVDQSNNKGETALIHAASNGHNKYVRLLIKAGANVNHLDKLGRTALIISASVRSVECMELLLEAGTNVNGVDINGNTALICCLNSYYHSKVKACLKLLIDAGADIDVQNNNNSQPIHYALERWQRVTCLAEYLISENCNLSQASYDPVKSFYVQLREEDRLDILKLLFACGLPRHLCQTFIVEKDASIKNWWIETVASQTNTLKSICVFEIRKTLGPGIKSKVTKLNLPNVIQNLILLKGILSLECFD